jgi:hypothetical protein
MEFMSHVYPTKVLCNDIMRLLCFNVGWNVVYLLFFSNDWIMLEEITLFGVVLCVYVAFFTWMGMELKCACVKLAYNDIS